MLLKKNFYIILALALLVTCFSCKKSHYEKGAFLARDKKYYDKLDIDKKPAVREDGMRTSGKEGSYEWWYTDAEFHDGTKIVVVFYTKNTFDVPGPAWPTATINIDIPGKKSIVKAIQEEEGTLLKASRDRCDVRVKDSYIRYKNGIYYLRYKDDTVDFNLTMKPRITMWRPGTGHWYFGKEEKMFFAWFVAVPAAELDATLKMNGTVKKIKGTGYHDHNWGNVEMNKVLNHWYWSRVVFKDYTVIACDLVSEKEFGYTRLPVFMIARKSKILSDNEQITDVVRSNTARHPVTKKFIDNTLTFHQAISKDEKCTLQLISKKDIFAMSLLDAPHISSFKRWVARLIGKNPTYIRTTGDARLTITEKGKNKTFSTSAIWEQMFFGSNKKAVINDYRKL